MKFFKKLLKKSIPSKRAISTYDFLMVNQDIDLTLILKHTKSGEKLYCPFLGPVEFEEINKKGYICVRYVARVNSGSDWKDEEYSYAYFDKNGRFVWVTEDWSRRYVFKELSECCLFPSDYNRNWHRFNLK